MGEIPDNAGETAERELTEDELAAATAFMQLLANLASGYLGLGTLVVLCGAMAEAGVEAADDAMIKILRDRAAELSGECRVLRMSIDPVTPPLQLTERDMGREDVPVAIRILDGLAESCDVLVACRSLSQLKGAHGIDPDLLQDVLDDMHEQFGLEPEPLDDSMAKTMQRVTNEALSLLIDHQAVELTGEVPRPPHVKSEDGAAG
jgi:hypothetical protein